MKLRPEDEKFIRETLGTVQGWVTNDAGYLTSALLRWQEREQLAGPVMEIGIFAGKYLSLLYHLTQETGDRVLGIDTFQWYPREKVEETFNLLYGAPERLRLHSGDSMLLTAGQIIDRLGAKPRFISVDGSHTALAVLSDLNLSEQLLARGGIVAIDDVLNRHAIGVGEGAYRYFLSRDGMGLVPFAYSANKLYVTHRADADRCRDAVWQFTRTNPNLKLVNDFNGLLAKSRDWVEQALFGHQLLIL